VGWTLTSAGRAARERIEARTNELAAAPFCRLSMAERAGLAAILRDLPA
jgi:hypothetical protein